MKLRFLLPSFALLSWGIIPVAVAEPNSLTNADINQQELETSKVTNTKKNDERELLQATDFRQKTSTHPITDIPRLREIKFPKTSAKYLVQEPPSTEVSPSPATPTEANQSPATPTQVSQSPATPTQVSQSPTTPTEANQSPATPTEASPSPTKPTEVSPSPTLPNDREEVLKVTGVRLNATANGLEVILQTATGQLLKPTTTSDGNTLVADIPMAVLALPQGNEFRAVNPAKGISLVRVTQLDASSIRVSVTGVDGVPTAQVVPSQSGLVLSLSLAAESPEEIEITVTGTRDSGYTVPDATTATKIPVPLRDIPQSIEVIPRRVIEDRAVVRQDELTDNVSGVQRAIGFGESSGYYIRGFFVGYESLRNGFRDIGTIAPRGLANVERVEFLKGPAAVVYGSGFAPGGIVNTVTKKPLDTPFYRATMTAGNYSFYYPTLDITGPLTANRSLLYRLNASYRNAGSYRDFTEDESYFVAPAFTWRIDPRTTLSIEFEYLNSNYIYESGFPLVPESLRLPVNRFLSEPGLNRSRLNSTSITYDFEHKFNANWRVRQGFNAVIANIDIGDARLGNLSLEADGRTLDRQAIRGPQDNHNYTLQNEIFGKFNTGPLRHNVLVGLELSRYNYGYKVFGAALAPIDIFEPRYGARPAPFSLSFAGEYGSDNLGIYFQDLVEILPNLKLLGGGRFDFNDSFNKDRPNGEFLNRQSENRFSPRVGIVYQPSQSTSLYFNWSNYFSPQFSARSRTNEIFKPDIGQQFEVGIKQDLLANRLSATLALYQITRQNVLTPDPVDPQNFSVQTGEQKSRGVELDVAGQVLPGWNIIATYAYTDTFVSRDNSIPIGNQLIGVPYNSASLWTTYELQRGNWKGLGFGLGLVYAGDVQVALPNTFKAPSYLRTDAALFYRRDNFRIGLNIKNIFNVKYFYTDGGFALYPAAPLTVLGTMSVQF